MAENLPVFCVIAQLPKLIRRDSGLDWAAHDLIAGLGKHAPMTGVHWSWVHGR